MLNVYLYDQNENPIMVPEWYCGKIIGKYHERVRPEKIRNDEFEMLSIGCQFVETYRIIASDRYDAIAIKVSSKINPHRVK